MKTGKFTKGFTCGTFDLCHAGHILMFQECKEVCDYLIVGIMDDPSFDRPIEKRSPVMSLEERHLIVSSIQFVDEVITYSCEKFLFDFFLKNPMDIDVRIAGADWFGRIPIEAMAGIPVHYNSRDHHFSTTNIRARVLESEASLPKEEYLSQKANMKTTVKS